MINILQPWDVWLANVPFEDIDESKCRPVVVIQDYCCSVDCVKMTSHTPRQGEYSLVGWKNAGLKKPTVVRVQKRLNMTAAHLIHKIGHLDPVDILALQKLLV